MGNSVKEYKGHYYQYDEKIQMLINAMTGKYSSDKDICPANGIINIKKIFPYGYQEQSYKYVYVDNTILYIRYFDLCYFSTLTKDLGSNYIMSDSTRQSDGDISYVFYFSYISKIGEDWVMHEGNIAQPLLISVNMEQRVFFYDHIIKKEW